MALTDELREKWCTALRSGDYKQGKGALLNDGKYCCLGVLYEAVLGGTWGFVDSDGDTQNSEGSMVYLHGLSELDVDVEEKVACMNDSEDKSFSEIADWLEEHKV